MSRLITTIPQVRESVAAVLRLHRTRPESTEGGEVHPAQFQMSFGSGFCVLEDRYVVTAFHNLNGGQPGIARVPEDRFYLFTVPGNGEPAYHFPVVAFPVERPDLDLAVLEIGPCAVPGMHIPAVAVSFAPRPDGTRVVTVGYPAPEVYAAEIDPDGAYRGGQFFLKSHANEGIVSAQYTLGGTPLYELNVGWHHGESGGPIVALDDPAAAFSIMQQYRNVQSPHGVVAGPHRGVALSTIEAELAALGVSGV
jgi:hypothetical protein